MSAVAQSEPVPVGVRSARWAPALGALFALVLLAATVEIVVDGAAGISPLIPKSPAIAGWLSEIGERLGFRVFLIALLVAIGGYAGLLALARLGSAGRVSKRWAIVLIAALHAIVFVGPILISTDVFSYIAYARMGVEHGLNPYLHGPASISHDPVFLYVGHDWRRTATAYGPLYTLLSYPLAPLGVVGALWAMKIDRAARERRHARARLALRAPARPRPGVGAARRRREPAVRHLRPGRRAQRPGHDADDDGRGHAHDRPARVAGPRSGRRGDGGGGRAREGHRRGAAAVHDPLQAPPRADTRRARGARAGLLVGYVAFGIHGVDVVAALNRDAAFVSTDSFATEIAHLFGKPGVFPIDHDLLKAASC